MNENEYQKLNEDLEAASFKADLAFEFPESYSTEEIIQIAQDIDTTNKKTDEAMREEFVAMPVEHQDRMIGLLAEHSDKSRQWWRDYLS